MLNRREKTFVTSSELCSIFSHPLIPQWLSRRIKHLPSGCSISIATMKGSLNVHICDQQSFIIKLFTLMKPFVINWRHWMISFVGYNLFWVCFLTVPEPKLFETKIILTKMFQPQDASFSFRRHFRLNQFMNTVGPRSKLLRVKKLMIIPLLVMRVQLRTP